MNRFSLEAKVGIFFLATVAIVAYVWLKVLDVGVKDGFVLKAHFRSVEGLVQDAQVQIAGIKIGSVKDVQFDSETGKAAVTMLINDSYRNSIPEGSRLFIRSKGLAGDKYLVIEPGKPNARKLKPGEEITLVFESTDPDKVLESVGVIAQNLQVVTREVRKQIIDQKGSERIDSILDNSDSVFKDLRSLLTRNKEKINQTIDNTDATSKNMNELVARNKTKINRTVDDAEKYYKSMGEAGDKFGKAATDLEALAKEVRSGRGTLGKLVTDESLYRNAQALVTEVRGISNNIQRGSGTMGRLINDPEIYYEARRAIRNMNKTAEDVSEATPVSTLAIILGSVFR
jgi:phospholipid/cholesterol/gamma-HCH transport system substrate-binding protein